MTPERLRRGLAGLALGLMVLARPLSAEIPPITPDRIGQLETALTRGGVTDDQAITAIVQIAQGLRSEGRRAEALALLGHFGTVFAQRRGPEDRLVLWLAATRAATLHETGAAVDAIALYQPLLGAFRQTLEPGDPLLALGLIELAQMQEEAGALEAAIALYRELRLLLAQEQPDDHAFALEVTARLQRVLLRAGHRAEADGLRAAMDAHVAALARPGAGVPAERLVTLATSLRSTGDATNAGRRAILLESAGARLDPADASLRLVWRRDLAAAYLDLGRPREGLSLLAANLADVRRDPGPQTPEMFEALGGYATAMTRAGRYDALGPILDERLALGERLFGPDDPNTLSVQIERIPLMMRDGRMDEARRIARQVAGVFARELGEDSPDTLAARLALATTLADLGDMAAARAGFERLLPDLDARLGPNHPYARAARTAYAMVLSQGGETAGTARELHEVLLQGAPDDAAAAGLLDQIALGALSGGRVVEALEAARRARAIKQRILVARGDEDGADLRRELALPLTLGLHLTALRAALREGVADGADRARLAAEGFLSAQLLGFDRTDEAVRKAALRAAAGPLGAALRQRDDLLGAFRQEEAALARALGQGHDDAADAASARLAALNDRIAALATRIAAQDDSDARAALLSEPVAAREVQGLLGAEDALILLSPGPDTLDPNGAGALPEMALVWVITREAVVLHTPPVAAGFGDRIARLRAQLDRPAGVTLAARAPVQPGRADRAGGMAPVELSLAYGIYDTLFGAPAVAGALAGKSRWIVVPRGPFLSLPFAALVEARPSVGVATRPDELRAAHWLGLRRDLTVLPSVAALRLLERRPDTGTPGGRLAYLGLGDPDFAGAAAPLRAEGQSRALAAPDRIAAVRGLPRLAGTGEELRRVARAFDPDASRILTGAEASEAQLDALARSGVLGRARIVHFATHGLLAGGIDGLDEPALALSPPTVSRPLTDGSTEDGLLTGAEIARLSLSADWVVLSACNTAGSGQITADGLSGLARAFFHAGARSLLVTHWAVRDDVAARLIADTVTDGAQSGDRAAALRGALARLVADRSADDTAYPYAHPALWAPFHIIGSPR